MFKQGQNYLSKLQNKIIQGSQENDKEGFNGILGSNNALDSTMARDTENTATNVSRLNNNIAQYGTDYVALKTKTEFYLNDGKNNNNMKKNYNIFVNKSINQDKITETNQLGCVKTTSISNTILATGFNEAYSTGFNNYNDANTACKLWAADSSSTVYGLNQDPTTGKFRCILGNALDPNIEQYTKPKNLYTVTVGGSGEGAGGVFTNGQIGVWNGLQNIKWNTTLMKRVTYIKKYNSSSYGPNDMKPMNDAVKWGWWGNSQPGKPNNWGFNMWPNDSSAWWIGNLDTKPDSYFYYVYDAPARMIVFSYLIFPNPAKQVLKVNGQRIRLYTIFGHLGGSFAYAFLNAGKNVFEVSSASNFPGSGFMMYWTKFPDIRQILFRTGDPGWGVATSQTLDWRLISNTPTNPSNPYGKKTINAVPSTYAKCDALYGGSINTNSITAEYGRNCSNLTNPPLSIRYINVFPNKQGECLQIAQIVVNAIINGKVTNVAGRGTVTASPTWRGGTRPETAIDGTLAPRAYPNIYHSVCEIGTTWKLDLGQDYLVTQIIYYNRSDCCSQRANGMMIEIYGRGGIKYFYLTGELTQSFNVSK